ncbi:MAG: sensor histidine kinase [Flavobacterium sp.]|nr:sensor histidine kinase [Flavobacterium sp.]
MFIITTKSFKKIVLCFLTATILFACNNKKVNGVLFEKEIPINEDATKVYLNQASNYKKDKNYFAVLYKYYNQKIEEQKYLQAAEILDISSIFLADSYDFNEKYMSVIKLFDVKYRNKIPALKTTFIDAYLANYYFDKSDLKKASHYFQNITPLEPNDYDSCYHTARAFYDLSYVYYIMGKQNLSLDANQKSLEYFTKINNPKGLAFVYSNYANIYTAIGDKKRAIINADKAIKAYESINNTYNVYIGLINKISIFDFMNDNRKIALIDSTYQAFKTSKDESKILKIKIFDYKIENLVQANELLEAKKVIDELKPIVEEINSDDLTLEYKVALAQYKIKINPNYSDFEDIRKALPTLITNQQYEKVNMFYGVLQTSAIQNNDFKEAFDIEKDKVIIADSISDIATRSKIAELETIYQTQKKQQQIVLQNKTIQNNNNIIALLIASLIAVLVSGLAFSLKRKQQKLKLEKENAQLYTKQLLEKTEEERKRIASDLHDSVSHELLSLKNSFDQKTEITNNKIDAIINDIRIISRNLHPIMFDKIGLKASVEQLVERTQSVNDFMVTAEIEYNNFLSTNDELQLYRIIQEALSNIIKYANAVAAKITINQINNSLFVEIKDNGKGFNFNEKLNGKNAFGLHNIIERSRAIGGQANIISDKNGTIITIDIKKQ